MVQLADVREHVRHLSREDREGLVTYLLHGLEGMPLGPDDEEVARREAEMDTGTVAPISHAEFLSQVGRAG